VAQTNSTDNTVAPVSSKKSIAIIGSGIAGLSSAYFLSSGNSEITIFESSEHVGGLGTTFKDDDIFFEKFYHCMLPTDSSLLSLLEQLGIKDKVYWSNSYFAIFSKGNLLPLNSATDLLRFNALPLLDRIRVGLTGLWGRICKSNRLDDVTAAKWLTNLSGKRAFEEFWAPLLIAKFGDAYDQVPALWFWTRFNREKSNGTEKKGYISGGYHEIAQSLIRSLSERNVKMNLNTSVESITINNKDLPVLTVNGAEQIFDQILLTTPLPILDRISKDRSNDKWKRLINFNIDYQGVINVVLFLKKKFSKYYWVATPESHIPFQGIVETSNIMTNIEKNGRNIVYLTRYLNREDPYFQTSDKNILDDFTNSFHKLFTKITPDDILKSFVFKAPFVEPIYTTNYFSKQPPIELIPGRLFYCSTVQIYPEVTSWNSSIGFSKQVASKMLLNL
jgi:protoporphyrinogen oxidase